MRTKPDLYLRSRHRSEEQACMIRSSCVLLSTALAATTTLALMEASACTVPLPLFRLGRTGRRRPRQHPQATTSLRLERSSRDLIVLYRRHRSLQAPQASKIALAFCSTCTSRLSIAALVSALRCQRDFRRTHAGREEEAAIVQAGHKVPGAIFPQAATAGADLAASPILCSGTY